MSKIFTISILSISLMTITPLRANVLSCKNLFDHQLTFELHKKKSEDVIKYNLAKAAQLRDFEVYRIEMDQSMEQKMIAIQKWLPKHKGAIIADIGTGTGNLAAMVARRFSQASVFGIDLSPEMLAIAERQNSEPNLTFKLGSAHKAFGQNVDAAIYSSILHEVYSYSEDSLNAVKEALTIARKSLANNGRLIIRDFVSPINASRKVLVMQKKVDMIRGHTLVEFTQNFHRNSHVKIIKETNDKIIYLTDMATAYEFIFHKDYHTNWDAELKEKYGFWTTAQAKNLLASAGFKVIYQESLQNQWIVKNRLAGKIKLIDPKTNQEIPFPNYQQILIAEKI